MAKQVKKQQKHLTQKQFVKTILSEIEEVVKTKPYHSFVLMASFNEFARLELGINIFKQPEINKGLNYLLNHYRPIGLWLTTDANKRDKHLKKRQGRIILSAEKTYTQIAASVNIRKLSNKKFLEV